jgi:hypothetical protein
VVVFEGRGTTSKRMWLVKEEVAYGETERRPRIIVTDGGKKDFTGKYKYHETVSCAASKVQIADSATAKT